MPGDVNRHKDEHPNILLPPDSTPLRGSHREAKEARGTAESPTGVHSNYMCTGEKHLIYCMCFSYVYSVCMHVCVLLSCILTYANI